MSPTVLKFGGSSFATAQGFHRVAAYVIERKARGEDMVVVVSAPPKLTESWRALLADVHENPAPRTVGGLLPRADTVGAYLLAAAFDAADAPNRVMPADLIGIETDDVFRNATPVSGDLTKVHETLAEGKIVIVPGGQAQTAQGDLTWLGKNSSDVSAILLAAYLGAERCTICSDVPGVYSGDPNAFPDARLMPQISYVDAITMSVAGAKVLHHRAVEIARDHDVLLELRLNRPPFDVGTTVGREGIARAVIPDERSKVFVFPDENSRQAGFHMLKANNLTLVDLPGKTGAPLVVTCGYSDPDAILRDAKIPFDRTPQKMLTLIQNGRVERTLCPSPNVLHATAALSHEAVMASLR